MSIEAYGYSLEKPNSPLEKKEFTIESVAADEVAVKVAGCGLCHTDLSFYTGEVKPKQMPVILGHEIAGTVVAAGGEFELLVGKKVIIPAVLPCGECDLCRAGRANVCQHQKFPGNDFDGGFATHVRVPGRYLCSIPANTRGFKLTELCVVADAITTPYQALVRSNIKPGELAIVIGVGGIGTYMVQHAKNAGAKVLALDIDAKKLETASRMGAHFTIDVKGMGEGDVKKVVRDLIRDNELPRYGWKVYETSGHPEGQKTAFSLLSFAGTLGVVGFTMEKINVRLSNIMAFDADVFGNWACKPEHYPKVVDDVIDGRINVRDNIEEHPLDSINEVIKLALRHKLEKRAVLVP